MFLLAGGSLDPNLTALLDAARQLKIPCTDLRLPPGSGPAFHWDLNSNQAWLDGQALKPGAAFIRHDVFAAMQDGRPQVAQRAWGWYQALQGWLLAQPELRIFNRSISDVAHNKPAALRRAQACGLRIPATLITNALNALGDCDPEATIAKPVAGGGACQTLAEARALLADAAAKPDADANTEAGAGVDAHQPAPMPAPMPAIVQPRLVAPELRVYVIGEASLIFEMRSPSLDYRVQQDAEVLWLRGEIPELEPLRALMRELGMDFGAADFKTDALTGELIFLELNTSPMFARFDWACEGRLCRAMLEHLMQI